ncbi:hypothetical protein [Chryseobacterium defluvii]|uniref:Uncharacterized protein n=1 Tax=Chryseobacterium defluvii TaxID=160396 RepID=A0A495SFA3_9FLAO|nr:hypothetical protein [Chryseobacterium defluvii]RKS98233.1 hypothetical protein BCF58_2374 [Chryseobacterium defluvii]
MNKKEKSLVIKTVLLTIAGTVVLGLLGFPISKYIESTDTVLTNNKK